MNELSESVRQLPDNLEDLSRFVLIGREKLTAVRAEIRAIEKVQLAAEVHEQKLHEAQEIAEAVLDAETKLGELTSKMEKAINQYASPTDGKSKKERLQELGINHHERFETLASHPEIVEQAKADARAEGRIVTRSDALNRIVQPRGPKQIVRDIKNAAHEEHEAFQEKKKEGVVSFEDIQKDREAQAILTHSTKADITKAIMAISDIQFLKSEDVRQMAVSLSKNDMEWLKGALKNSISILTFILHKLGG